MLPATVSDDYNLISGFYQKATDKCLKSNYEAGCRTVANIPFRFLLTKVRSVSTHTTRVKSTSMIKVGLYVFLTHDS